MKSVAEAKTGVFSPLLPFLCLISFLILFIFSCFILTKLIIWLKQNFAAPQRQPVANTYTQMPILWDSLKTKANAIKLTTYGS